MESTDPDYTLEVFMRRGPGGRRDRCLNDKKVLVIAVMLIAFGVMLITAALVSCVSPSAAVWARVSSLGIFSRQPVVVIDPGHGGIDGGAESAEGVCEKDINLSISMMVRDMLDEYDVKVLMTRQDDKGLYTGVTGDGSANAKIKDKRSIRSLKTEDLTNRREMADKIMPDAFVSIHLNSFKEDRTVFGAQTFYSDGATPEAGILSRELGETIQGSLLLKIDNGNERVALEKGDVLMLKRTEYPAVIVECGFLSNGVEAKLLEGYDYQRLLAEGVAGGIVNFLKLEKKIGVVKSN